MTDNIEKAIDLADKVVDKTSELAAAIPDASSIAMENIMNIATKYGPDAYQFGLVLGRIDAIQHLMVGLIGVITIVVILIINYKVFYNQYNIDEDYFPSTMLGMGSIIAVAAITTLSALNLFSIYAWTGVFYPEVWLAAKALGWG